MTAGGRRNQRQQHGDGHGPSADGGHGGQRQPEPVTGTTTSLSVLGADARYGRVEPDLQLGGDDAAHRGGDATFSANGSNAAKNTTATFSKAGTYTFTVTITDPGGLTATSSVSVTVNQTVSAIAVSPASVESQRGGDAAVHGHGHGPVRRGDEPRSRLSLWTTTAGTIDVGGLLTAPDTSVTRHGDGRQRGGQRHQRGDGHQPPADGGHGGRRPARAR